MSFACPVLGLISTSGSIRPESQTCGSWDKSDQQIYCFGLCNVLKYLNQHFFFYLVDFISLRYLASLKKAESLARVTLLLFSTIGQI